ncbi:hypothetical protein BN137_2456 [Cronobacter condimenti 1330]|uniref:Uncharacterized protein n=1 Tax=Cronobacter condimenti 1330 TaxID=1073999 RepID=K8A1V4_9ENTR|nr:hypothetical protein BN137_2456 [Cronobacter condimenti 1330]
MGVFLNFRAFFLLFFRPSPRLYIIILGNESLSVTVLRYILLSFL